MIGSGERRKKRGRAACLHDHSLAAAGSGAGVDAHICSIYDRTVTSFH